MNIQGHVIKFRQKCISKLKREDAEYFQSLTVMKDLSLFSLMLKTHPGIITSEFEANILIVRYLQTEMVLASISDDYRDVDLFERFGLVPFDCEDIIKSRRPRRDPDQLQRSYDYIKANYPLHIYWNLVGIDCEKMQERIPKQHHAMLDKVFEYYTTPIVGVCAVMRIKPRDFHFDLELTKVLSLVLKRHFTGKNNKNDQEAKEFVEVMRLIINQRALAA